MVLRVEDGDEVTEREKGKKEREGQVGRNEKRERQRDSTGFTGLDFYTQRGLKTERGREITGFLGMEEINR